MKNLSWACPLVVALSLGCQAEPPAQSPDAPATDVDAADTGPGAPPPPHGKLAACTTDQSCNADPAISALWGKCDVDTGKCSCLEGAEQDPISERCSPIAP